MEGEQNATYVILDGYVNVHKYRYIYFMTVFIVYILIICSNSTIVYLIWKHQDLHEPMYVFIAALLLNSVLFSTNIYPKLLIDFLSEKQIISYQACLVQYFMFYTLGSSEFLLLAAMAYDRYVSICKPLQYPTIMRKTNVSILLALAWFLPACQLIGSVTMSANQKLLISIYGVIILLNIAVIPVFFIVFTYVRILIICYRSCADVRKKAAQTCLPHLLVLTNVFVLITYDVITVRLESDFPKTARLIMILQLVLYNPLLNPLIYGLRMKEISKHLQRWCLLSKKVDFFFFFFFKCKGRCGRVLFSAVF
uniref:G-protein coupled receptors family 1 profile domain-containing protein n=1 Tax=Anabas testudineus TaxID=64144 RepID=A0A7N6ALV3_ANATE